VTLIKVIITLSNHHVRSYSIIGLVVTASGCGLEGLGFQPIEMIYIECRHIKNFRVTVLAWIQLLRVFATDKRLDEFFIIQGVHWSSKVNKNLKSNLIFFHYSWIHASMGPWILSGQPEGMQGLNIYLLTVRTPANLDPGLPHLLVFVMQLKI